MTHILYSSKATNEYSISLIISNMTHILYSSKANKPLFRSRWHQTWLTYSIHLKLTLLLTLTVANQTWLTYSIHLKHFMHVEILNSNQTWLTYSIHLKHDYAGGGGSANQTWLTYSIHLKQDMGDYNEESNQTWLTYSIHLKHEVPYIWFQNHNQTWLTYSIHLKQIMAFPCNQHILTKAFLAAQSNMTHILYSSKALRLLYHSFPSNMTHNSIHLKRKYMLKSNQTWLTYSIHLKLELLQGTTYLEIKHDSHTLFI